MHSDNRYKYMMTTVTSMMIPVKSMMIPVTLCSPSHYDEMISITGMSIGHWVWYCFKDYSICCCRFDDVNDSFSFFNDLGIDSVLQNATLTYMFLTTAGRSILWVSVSLKVGSLYARKNSEHSISQKLVDLWAVKVRITDNVDDLPTTG